MQITIILNPNVKKSKFKMNKIELLKDSDIPIYFKSFKDRNLVVYCWITFIIIVKMEV